MTWARRLARDARGVVMIEFLVAFMPVLVLFLGAVQLALLAAAQLVVQHAAIAGGRSAAVVLDDDRARYAGEPCGAITGARLTAIQRAVGAPLATLPGLPTEPAAVTFPVAPGSDVVARDFADGATLVTLRVEHLVPCEVPIARFLVCPLVALSDGKTKVRARRLSGEASLPRFSARYLASSECAGDET